MTFTGPLQPERFYHSLILGPLTASLQGAKASQACPSREHRNKARSERPPVRPQPSSASEYAQVTERRRPGAAPCTVGNGRGRTRTTCDMVAPFVRWLPRCTNTKCGLRSSVPPPLSKADTPLQCHVAYPQWQQDGWAILWLSCHPLYLHGNLVFIWPFLSPYSHHCFLPAFKQLVCTS